MRTCPGGAAEVRDLPKEALGSAVRRCNFCFTKADNVRGAAIAVAAAGVPSSYEALMDLPRRAGQTCTVHPGPQLASLGTALTSQELGCPQLWAALRTLVEREKQQRCGPTRGVAGARCLRTRWAHAPAERPIGERPFRGVQQQGRRRSGSLPTWCIRAHSGTRITHRVRICICRPGVGPKIANLMLSVAFGEADGDGAGIVVDTHVNRVARQLGWASGRGGAEAPR